MSQPNCPRCNHPVSGDLPGGLCPTCLMAAAQASAPAVTGSRPQSARYQAPSSASMAKLFPELEILELIGQGGMGAVYRVRQKNLDRIVALKVFLAPPDDVEFAARFQREARALAKLNHPNIVTVHDFGIRDKTHYLIMEFVAGMNLRQLSAAEKISPKLALEMVPQLCDALQYAHDQGVIHRDIKPENLLVGTTGGIKIADFGLAKMTDNGTPDSLTRTRQIMGTLNYMAPEQREHPTEVDHRADIYSLGVVIYEMLTGELPLGRFQPPSSKSDLDRRLDEAVMRALEREPDRRYQQASELKTGMSHAESPLGESIGTRAANFAAGFRSAFYNPPRPPVKSPGGPPAIGSAARRWMFTVMSGRERKGNWQTGEHLTTVTVMGGTKLDLTAATSSEIDLTTFTLLGATEIIVPYGTTVDLDGMIVMGAVTEKVGPSSDANAPLRVRVRAWGAMGGCDVRTPKNSDATASGFVRPQPPVKPNLGIHSAHGTTIGRGLVFLFRMIAMLVTFAIPIVALAGAFGIGKDRDDYPMIVALVALAAGLIWSELKYFRVLVRGGAEAQGEASIRKYESATLLGSAIRGLALIPAFGCPMLFVIAAFAHHEDSELRFAGIVCGIVSIALFSVANYSEAFFYGKRE